MFARYQMVCTSSTISLVSPVFCKAARRHLQFRLGSTLEPARLMELEQGLCSKLTGTHNANSRSYSPSPAGNSKSSPPHLNHPPSTLLTSSFTTPLSHAISFSSPYLCTLAAGAISAVLSHSLALHTPLPAAGPDRKSVV